jgi:outer membrane protein assembly factor BamB
MLALELPAKQCSLYDTDQSAWIRAELNGSILVRRTLLACLILSVSSLPFSHADNWPTWRGPTGQGLSAEKKIPLKWSATENVKWKVPLADAGNSTPVVWGDKIFLTQANRGGSKRSLLCFLRGDGSLLWQHDVAYAEKERAYQETWYVNASPVVDAERVVVSFASAGMYCYDHAGKELWKRTDLGKWEHQFGSGASPVLYGDLAILWCGPNEKGRNFLIAVNKTTGATVWEQDQSYGSWATPVIVKVNGQDQFILGQSRDVKGEPDEKASYLRGFDPKSGKELWKCQGMNSYVYASALYSDGIAVGMSGYGGAALAVKLGGSGDITKDRLWKHAKNNQRVGSGTIVGEHIYMVDENSAPHCYELQTGTDLWKDEKRPGSGITWGSMVYADGRLYVLMRDGETLVFAASPKYELLTVNRLSDGEETNSSLAISNGDIFIRTFTHLWCIGAKK